MTRKVQQQSIAGSASGGITATETATDCSGSTLKEVLTQVARDEADAIQILCTLLEQVEESRQFACLHDVRKVLKEWQNLPPRGIVTDLMKIAETLK